LLSDKALYSFVFELDIETKKTKAKLYFRVPTLQIQSITVSPLADNYMVFHFAPAANVRDVLQACRRKTEFLGVLSNDIKKQGRTLALSFDVKDTIVVDPKEKKIVEVTWVKDTQSNIPQGDDKLVLVKSNSGVEIHVPPGLQSNEVKAPAQVGGNTNVARSMLKAMFDCKGNGIDELAFKTGDLIAILKNEQDGWYEGELNGQRGFVPATYVEKIKIGGNGQTEVRPEKKQAITLHSKVAAPIQKSSGPPQTTKSKWKEMFTDDGERYYWNEDTGASEWELPAELEHEVFAERKRKESMAKVCAVAGCTNNRFSGRPYCVSHLQNEGKTQTKTTTTTPTTSTPSYQSQPVQQQPKQQQQQPIVQSKPQQVIPQVKPQQQQQPVQRTTTNPTMNNNNNNNVNKSKPSQPTTANPIPIKTQVQPVKATQASAKQVISTGVSVKSMQANVVLPGMGKLQPKPVKKSDWTEQWDEGSKSNYYYNNVTGESVWDKPSDF